jgi:phosphoribosylformylglycinamidine cyclo-ligase
MDYKQAGVDVVAGRAFVDRIRNMVASTQRPEVLGGIGGFSGYFQLPTGYREPILVSGTDGVGTKLKLAQQGNQHSTVGIDLVAMCVNDILTSGAEPLFFLDYLAISQLDPEQMTQVVSGIVEGCKQSGCTLLGGETAEMPGFYQPGEYDLAGFAVGVVEKSQLLDGSQVRSGDVAIGLASSGVHSNGFSLVRKIVFDRGYNWTDTLFHLGAHLGGACLGEVLLTPTQIYVKPVLGARNAGIEIHAMAHITGGGLPENLPRCLPPGKAIEIDVNTWTIPPIFEWISTVGEVSRPEMFNTFNMGIGFVVLVPPNQADQAIQWFESQQISASRIGEVIDGSGGLIGIPEN